MNDRQRPTQRRTEDLAGRQRTRQRWTEDPADRQRPEQRWTEYLAGRQRTEQRRTGNFADRQRTEQRRTGNFVDRHLTDACRRLMTSACVSLAFIACQPTAPRDNSEGTPIELHHATLFEMQQIDDTTTAVQVLDPYAPGRIAAEYRITPTTTQRRITLTASCHGYLLSHLLHAADAVVACCDTQYVLDTELRRRLRDGRIAFAGDGEQPNAEVLASLRTDAVWLSPRPVGAGGSNAVQTATAIGATIVWCADYLEPTPLGRAEWMRLYGRLVGRGREADSLFALVEARYDSIAHRSAIGAHGASATDDADARRPMLLPERLFRGVWYVPGGQSASACLYRDAGYAYPWADDAHTTSLALSPEAVISRASQADIWVLKYFAPEGDWTIGQLLQQEKCYSLIHAAQTGEVYGCNTATSLFFDETPFRPDLLLESLQQPGRLYFKRMTP